MKKKFLLISVFLFSLFMVACNTTTNTAKFIDIKSLGKYSVNENSIEASEYKKDIEKTDNTVSEKQAVVIEKGETNMEKEDSAKINESKVDIAARHLDELYENKNILYSPLSLNMALGMLQEGSNGKSLTDISNFLQNDNYGEFAKKYISDFKEYSDKVSKWRDFSFDICNSIWVDESFDIEEDYKKSLEDKYLAESFNVDYSDKKIVDLMNGWISEKTKERIPQILSEVPADTLLTLINTVYFKDEWNQIGFEVDSTFTSLDGDTKDVKAARFSDNDFYYENSKAVGFGKKYTSGLYFIGILPKGTNEFELNDLNLSNLLETESKKYDVKVTIPKFEFESNSDLNKLFIRHGLISLFTNPDFSKISDDKLNLSQVIQGCNISFDENGTTAAAATVMMMNKAAMPEFKEVKEIIFDRPFAFMIYDKENNEVVFIGKVLDV